MPGTMNPGPKLPQLQFSNTDSCMRIRTLTWENMSNGTYSKPLEEASVYESFDILLERCLPTHKIDALQHHTHTLTPLQGLTQIKEMLTSGIL